MVRFLADPPFTFGVLLSASPTVQTLRARVARAEELGYSAVYLSDHLGQRLGPIASLAAAATESSTLRLGTLVLNCLMRNPVVLAQELATIDLLSNGRLDVGLGAGWMTADFAQAGIAMEPPADRLGRLVEYVDILEQFWASEEFSYDGTYYQLRDVSCTPRPRQERPRLIIGAAGPKALRFAGQHADIVGIDVPHPSNRPDTAELLAGSTRGAYLERARVARSAATAADRAVILQMQVPPGLIQLDPTASQIDEIAARWHTSPGQLGNVGSALVGDIGAVRERLAGWRRETGVSDIVLHAVDMEAAASLVAAMSGT